MELVEYHGGGQRGGIRVLEGYRGKGWARFAKELTSFFLGTPTPARELAGKHQNGKQKLGRKARDSCDIQESVTDINPSKPAGLNSNAPRIQLVPGAPRPTRKYEFKWDPFLNTLQITKVMGEKRRVEWVGLKYKAKGLAQFIAMDPIKKDQDQAFDEDLTHGLQQGPVIKTQAQDPSMEKLEASSTGVDLATKTEASSSSSDTSDNEIPPSPFNFDCEQVEAPTSLAVWVDLAPPEIATQTESGCEPQRLSFLSDSLFEQGEASQAMVSFVTSEREAEEHVTRLPMALAVEPGGDVISCEPLAMIGPPEPTESQQGFSPEPSTWVKQRHCAFCKLVGFPIECHKQECLALLQHIEANRFVNKVKVGWRKQPASGRKGSRELRRLTSSVNYEGRQTVC